MGRRNLLRRGVITDAARAAFTIGQCAELALAWHPRTNWPLVVLVHGNSWMSLGDKPDVLRAANAGRPLSMHILNQCGRPVAAQK